MTAHGDDAARWQPWDDLVRASPAAGFMQTSAWARVRTRLGFDHFAVVVRDGAQPVGGALVCRWQMDGSQGFYAVQDGPLLPDDPALAAQVFAEVMSSVRRHAQADAARISHLRIEPRWTTLPAFVQGFVPPAHEDVFTEPRDTLCIDLRGAPEQILAQMKPKGRYNVRLAQRHGVQVVEDNSAQGLADFIRIQRRTAERQHIGTKPPGYFRTLLAELGPDGAATLHFAECRGRRLAAALVVWCGTRATYFYGGSLVLHRPVMAPYALHHAVMLQAQGRGCTEYDLWGVAPPGAEDHPWQQISDFKRRFGGGELALVPTLDLVLDAAAYHRHWQVAADSQAAAPA